MIINKCGTHISCVQNILFISSECPFHTREPHALTIDQFLSLDFFRRDVDLNSESGTSNRIFFFVLFPFSISLLPSHCFCQAEPSFLQHFLSVSSVI